LLILNRIIIFDFRIKIAKIARQTKEKVRTTRKKERKIEKEYANEEGEKYI
jgi:hypothetical protein